MARVSRGVQAHAKHKKVLKKAKGYYGAVLKFIALPSKRSSKQDSTHTVTVDNVVVSSEDCGLFVSTLRQEIMV